MKVKVKDLKKTLAFFVLSLAFYLIVTTFIDDYHSEYIFLNWIVGLIVFRLKVLSQFYIIFFGLFFIAPVMFLGGEEFLSQGTFFPALRLNDSQIDTMLLSVWIALVSMFTSSILFSSDREVAQKINYTSYKDNYLVPFTLTLLCIVFVFNILEFKAVVEQGYYALINGSLDVKKGFAIAVAEYAFVALVCILTVKKTKWAFIFLIIYALSSMLSGARLPSFCLLMLVFSIFLIEKNKRPNLLLYMIVAYIVFTPFLMYLQDVRFNSEINEISSEDLIRYYTDIWNVVGFSYDTLKVSVINSNVDFTLFSKLLKWVEVIVGRIFDASFKLEYNGFGTAYTFFYDSNLYYSGGSVASSSIAEIYVKFGFAGIVFYYTTLGWFLCFLNDKLRSKNPYYILFLIIFYPRILVSVRNESLGWFFEGLVYFIVSILILKLSLTIMNRKKSE